MPRLTHEMKADDEEDRRLAQAAAKGDRNAFSALMARHYALIYRVSYRFTGRRQDAEDVTQDICLRLARTIGGFKGGSRFTTWLYRVTVNACRDHLRRTKRTDMMQHRYLEEELNRTKDDHEQRVRLLWLARAMEGLEPPYRETAILVLDEQLSHAEAAQALGCTEITVSWRMHAIRKRLKSIRESEAA